MRAFLLRKHIAVRYVQVDGDEHTRLELLGKKKHATIKYVRETNDEARHNGRADDHPEIIDNEPIRGESH